MFRGEVRCQRRCVCVFLFVDVVAAARIWTRALTYSAAIIVQ